MTLTISIIVSNLIPNMIKIDIEWSNTQKRKLSAVHFFNWQLSLNVIVQVYSVYFEKASKISLESNFSTNSTFSTTLVIFLGIKPARVIQHEYMYLLHWRLIDFTLVTHTRLKIPHLILWSPCIWNIWITFVDWLFVSLLESKY